MTPNIKINFNDYDQEVYFGGQRVSGNVEITFPKAIDVVGIAIKICGFAQTVWNNKDLKTNTCFKRNRNKEYSGYEKYFSEIIDLVGSDDAPPTEISSGTHTYNFAYDLPDSAPSSFKGTHGHITYNAEVTLKRPGKLDQTYSEEFSVVKLVDVSSILRMGSECEVGKQFQCGTCISKSFCVKLRIFQTGFMTGQILFIQVEISNSEIMIFPQIRIALRQLIVYIADSPKTKTKLETVELICINSAHFDGTCYSVFDENLVVPLVAPTDSENSKIKIGYDIQVEAALGPGNKNIFLNCPITIGTVPFSGRALFGNLVLDTCVDQ